MPIDKRFREKEWNDWLPCKDGVLTERDSNVRSPLSNTSNVRFHSSPFPASHVTKKNTFKKNVHCYDAFFPFASPAVQQDPRGATLHAAVKEHLHEADRSHGGPFLN